jgi:hypothetical protein
VLANTLTQPLSELRCGGRRVKASPDQFSLNTGDVFLYAFNHLAAGEGYVVFGRRTGNPLTDCPGISGAIM